MMKSAAPQTKPAPSFLETAFCALATGLSIGLLDLAVGIAFKGYPFLEFSLAKYGPPSVSRALTTVGVAAFLVTLCYLLAWYGIRIFFHGVRPRPAALALAGFFFTLWLVGTANPMFTPASLLLGLIPALVTGFAVYQIGPPLNRDRLLHYGLFASFGLTQILALAWVNAYVDGLSLLTSLAARLAVCAGILATFQLTSYIRKTGTAALTQAVVFLFVLLVPILPWQAHPDLDSSIHTTDHAVKRVVLITVDSLRADALSVYGGKTETPNFDRLARDGQLYEKAFSPAPWTLPAVTSILTGLSPAVHLVVTEEMRLPGQLPTLADQMSAAGYATAAIVSNPYLASHSNLSKGFHEYYYLSPDESWLTPVPTLGSMLLDRLDSIEMPYLKGDRSFSTKELTEFARNWIQENQDRDFFLWIHYFDPHTPYSPPPEFLPQQDAPLSIGKAFRDPFKVNAGLWSLSAEERGWVRGLYQAEVSYVDQSLGRLFSFMRELKIYEETLIILTSDHGEEFWEHGLTYHGHTLYNELLLVPLMVKPPLSMGTEPSRISSFVSTRAIPVTVRELCRLSEEPAPMPTAALPIAQSAAYAESPIYSTALLFYDDQEALITNGYKYIRSRITAREELYDLNRDPGEKHSLGEEFNDYKELAQNLLRRVRTQAQQARRSMGVVPEQGAPSAETIKRLKGLGYIR